MAIKKKSAKKKMTKEKPSQDAHWATLCDEYEEVQKEYFSSDTQSLSQR